MRRIKSYLYSSLIAQKKWTLLTPLLNKKIYILLNTNILIATPKVRQKKYF